MIATIRLAESLRYEPLITSQLIRISIRQVATRLTVYLAADPEFPAQELSRIQAAFATVEFETIRLPVFLAERARTHILHTSPLSKDRASDMKFSPGMVLAKSRPGDCATFLRWQRAGIDAASLPLAQGMPAAKLAASKIEDECRRSLRFPLWMQNHVAFEELMMPDTILRWLGQAESENRAVITFCACERYRRVHTANVTQLNELVPEFLASVPADPLTGQPLSLIRWNSTAYAIYSYGENGVDDLGKGVDDIGIGADFGVRSWRDLPADPME